MLDGYGSKKFLFAIGVCILAFGYAVLAATGLPNLKEMFSTFVGILEVVTAAYLTGNIANKWVAAKADPTAAKPPAKSQQALVAEPAGKADQSAADDPLDRDVPGGGVS